MSSQPTDRAVDLTGGALLRPLIALSLPILATRAMQVTYNLADTFWVGRLGQDAVSALSFAWPFVFVLVGVGGGFATAGTILVAQHKGAEQGERIDRVAGQTIGFVLLLSVGIAVVGWLVAPAALALIGAERGTAIHAMAVEYTRTLFLGVSAMFGFQIFQALLRGWGDTRTPMLLMAISVALNVVIDPVFILGFEANPLFGVLGLDGLEAWLLSATGFTGFSVQGAAIATVISRGVAMVVGFWLLFSGRRGIHPALGDLRPRRDSVRRIIDVGAPLGVQQSMMPMTIVVLTAVIAIVGPAAVAAFGIGVRVVSFVLLPVMGLAQGTETAVGQNLGARQVARAKRAVGLSAAIVSGCMLIMGVVMHLFSEPIVSVFITGEGAGEVVRMGGEYLRIFGYSFVFLGLFQVAMGGFRGSGSSTTAMVLAIVGVWGIRVPTAYLGLVLLSAGATGAWIGMAVGNTLSALLVVGWFLRGTWTDSVVDTGRPAPTD